MSAADKEAWRRWAKAGGPKRKKKKRRKGSCRGRPCVNQLEFQQSKLVIMEAPQFQFIDRVLGIPVACRDRYAHRTPCRFVEVSQVQLSDRLLSCPFGSRTGVWPRQC